MNAKLALVLGFIIGLAAGVSGMFLARRDKAAGAPVIMTNNVAQEVASAVKEKNSRAPNWWQMDAPTPEVAPAHNGAEHRTNPQTTEARTNASDWGRDDWRNQTPEERQQRFMSFWSNQQVTARTSFISNVVLSTDEAVRFDVLTEAMNVRLRARLDPVVEKYQSGWRPSPEERTRLAYDVSAILISTYDEMDRNMPDGWREGATNSYFSLTQFVEPQYMPFMRGMSGWGGGPGGRPPGPPPDAPQPAR